MERRKSRARDGLLTLAILIPILAGCVLPTTPEPASSAIILPTMMLTGANEAEEMAEVTATPLSTFASPIQTPTQTLVPTATQGSPPPGATTEPTANPTATEPPSLAGLDTSYPNALDTGSQLALGTMLLEEMANTVTPHQAAALLPLWQDVQGKILQGDVEVSAIVVQIEGEMTPEQITDIAAMQLTQDDLLTWVQSQRASRGGGGGQEPAPGTAGPPGGGQGAGGRADATGKQFVLLLDPLIELLTQRAAG
ncbi:hypothetical protein ACFLUM_00885 [Chloroflexota bacterium]